jgi:hypothetical protein
MALYMVSYTSNGATLVFYAAAFPRLARNAPRTRYLREKYERGEISAEKYAVEESLEKNRVSNMSTVRFLVGLLSLRPDSPFLKAQSAIGYVAVLCLSLALLLPLKDNPRAVNYVLVL